MGALVSFLSRHLVFLLQEHREENTEDTSREQAVAEDQGEVLSSAFSSRSKGALEVKFQILVIRALDPPTGPSSVHKSPLRATPLPTPVLLSPMHSSVPSSQVSLPLQLLSHTGHLLSPDNYGTRVSFLSAHGRSPDARGSWPTDLCDRRQAAQQPLLYPHTQLGALGRGTGMK